MFARAGSHAIRETWHDESPGESMPVGKWRRPSVLAALLGPVCSRCPGQQFLRWPTAGCRHRPRRLLGRAGPDHGRADSGTWRPEQRKVISLIHQLKAQGRGVIFIPHNLQDIFAVSDRIVVLRRGVPGRRAQDLGNQPRRSRQADGWRIRRRPASGRFNSPTLRSNSRTSRPQPVRSLAPPAGTPAW